MHILQLKPVALAVLHNAFCGPLPYLAFKEDQSLQNRLISSLMVHIVTVILSQQDHHLLQPYVCMMLKTESLKVRDIKSSTHEHCITHAVGYVHASYA